MMGARIPRKAPTATNNAIVVMETSRNSLCDIFNYGNLFIGIYENTLT